MPGMTSWGAPPPADPAWASLLDDARAAAGDPDAALALAERVAEQLPPPGQGRTAELWSGLADLAAEDLTVARALEPHLDALSILGQAQQEGYGVPPVTGTWGVFAAEGPGTRLEAHVTDGDQAQGHAVLSGRKPWCSLADRLDHALISAWVDDERRGLFAIDLRHPGVSLVDEPWAARGLSKVRSTGIDFDEVPGRQIGPVGWYLTRPGFAWGGLGVAACWLGGAIGLARRVRQAAQEREPDQIGLALLGEADARLTAAAAVLTEAAAAVDAGLVEGEHAWPRVVRARHIVHDACEAVLEIAAHGLGPGPLAGEEEHAARVADLQLYLRQHKAERDAAVVGRSVADGMPVAWDTTGERSAR